MQRDYYLNQKKALEINPRHPLIKELLRRVEDNPEDVVAKDMALMMYNTATLRSGYMLKDTVAFAQHVGKFCYIDSLSEVWLKFSIYHSLLETMMRETLGIDKDEAVDEEEELPEVEEPEDDGEEEDEEVGDEDEASEEEPLEEHDEL